MTSEEQVIIAVLVGLFLVIYVVPVLWVLLSGRSHGGAKFGWILVTIFFSWLGLAVFLIITQAPREEASDEE
jgi:Na+/melibiose symporter-like transporter